MVYFLFFFIFARVNAQQKNPRLYSVNVSNSWKEFVVKSVAPIPEEIHDGKQARQIAHEAALAQAREALLTAVLSQKTQSGRTLSVAEVPSLELQSHIRTLVSQALIKEVQYTDKRCTLWLELTKKPLKKILKEN